MTFKRDKQQKQAILSSIIANFEVVKQHRDEITSFSRDEKIAQLFFKHNNRRAALILFLFLLMFWILPVSVLTADSSSPGIKNKITAIDHPIVKPAPTAVIPEDVKISEKIYGLRGLSNVGKVSPAIFRGSQPLPEGYITLKKMGIKTVINLRTSKNEKKVVESTGMRSIEIPMNVLSDVNVETVNRIIEIMADPINQPVYIHCKLGQDRTGVVVAAYRMKVDGWSLSEAEAEMQAFGFNDLWYKLKKFIRKYAKSIGK